MKNFGLSQRRACDLLDVSRTVFHYTPKLNALNEKICKRMRSLAAKHKRMGVWQMMHIIRREEGAINHKRVTRLYRPEGLKLSVRRRKKLKSVSRLELPTPTKKTVDNGPEFISSFVDEWAYRTGVKLAFIRPGKPVENAYVESFNGKFRDKCLNVHYFSTLQEAKEIIRDWRNQYNTFIPHRSLRGLTPAAFSMQNLTEKLSLRVV